MVRNIFSSLLFYSILFLFVFLYFLEEEVKEISDEEDWQFVTIGDQVSQTSKAIKLTVQKNLLLR